MPAPRRGRAAARCRRRLRDDAQVHNEPRRAGGRGGGGPSREPAGDKAVGEAPAAPPASAASLGGSPGGPRCQPPPAGDATHRGGEVRRPLLRPSAPLLGSFWGALLWCFGVVFFSFPRGAGGLQLLPVSPLSRRVCLGGGRGDRAEGRGGGGRGGRAARAAGGGARLCWRKEGRAAEQPPRSPGGPFPSSLPRGGPRVRRRAVFTPGLLPRPRRGALGAPLAPRNGLGRRGPAGKGRRRLLVNYRLVNCGAREGRGGAAPAPGAVLAAGGRPASAAGRHGCGDRPAGAIRGAGGGHGNKGRRGGRAGCPWLLLACGGSPAWPALLLSSSPGGEDRSAAAPGPGCAGGIANEVRELHQKGERGGGGGAAELGPCPRPSAGGRRLSRGGGGAGGLAAGGARPPRRRPGGGLPACPVRQSGVRLPAPRSPACPAPGAQPRARFLVCGPAAVAHGGRQRYRRDAAVRPARGRHIAPRSRRVHIQLLLCSV